MKEFLLTSAIGLVLGTAALAQTSNPTQSGSSTSTPTSAQTQPATTQTPPSTTTQSSQSQTAPSTTSTASQSPAPGANGGNTSATSSSGQASGTARAQSTAPAQTQTGSTPPPSTANQAQQAPAPTGTSTTTAQQPNTRTNTAQQPNSQTNTTAQQPNTQTNTNTAQQPNGQTNTAQSSSTNVNAAVNLNDQQRTRISRSVARLDVKPLSNVNFSLSVGTAVPRDIRLTALPADIVEIVPQYRGYDFVAVRDEIVIVDPSTYQIVAVLPQSGRATASAPPPARERKHVTLSDSDREVIRKHVRSHVSEGRTTGSTVRTEIRTGDRLPDSVEIEAFPEEVYRESPSLREYRYLNRDSRTYIVEPQDRRILEEID
jgi:hypothetical protein